ncbi:kinase-like protein [Apiospora phragmitis]|uniref:Kinase-like protein n=1 Tax=Apiospora phragmitis TaxID=2905665 RepID=A0ABR1WSF7_9PEZI
MAIQSILTQTFKTEQERKKNGERLHQICGDEHQTSCRMVLTILVMERRVKYIDDFINKNIYDINLPISRVESADDHSFRMTRAEGSKSDTNSSFPDWEDEDLERFSDDQYRIHPKIRLPFTDWEWKERGGHGAISWVKIHKAHHGFGPSLLSSETDPVFAVKTTRTGDYEGYTREVGVLQRFNGSQKGHPHLIKLLMAFKHGMEMHLLFPWASGNLYQLWKANPEPKQSNETVQWLIKQCSGLANGLAKLHRHDSWRQDQDGRKDQLGRHGDIKPPNILWFASFDEPTQSQKNHLVLADFGLTIFHSSSGNTELTTANRLRGCSGTYRPPEVDLKNGKIVQSYDIWSLACVYLEFITWYLLGFKKTYNETLGSDPVAFADYRSLRDQAHEDKFFTIRKEGDKSGEHESVVKPEVKEWISHLRGLESCPQCLVDFLEYIQNYMLLPVALDRVNMSGVNRQLAMIKVECEERPEYCGGRCQSILRESARHPEEVPATGIFRDSTTTNGDAKAESSAHPFDLPGPYPYSDHELEKFIREQLSCAEWIPADEGEVGREEWDKAPDETERPSTVGVFIPGSEEHFLDRASRPSRKYHEMPHLDTAFTASTSDEPQLLTPAGSAAMATTPDTSQYFSDEESSRDGQYEGHDALTASYCESSVPASSLLSMSISPGTQHTSVPGASPSQAEPAGPTVTRVTCYGDTNDAPADSSKIRLQNDRKKGEGRNITERLKGYSSECGTSSRYEWNATFQMTKL